MPVVTLRSAALLTTREAMACKESRREFHLAQVNDKGDIQKFVDLKDVRFPKRARHRYQGYYPIDIQLDIPRGTYMLFSGERPMKRKFYLVGITATEIPDPSKQMVML